MAGEDDMVRCQTAVGSPMYMAPEIIQGLPYSYAVDFWSLGVLFFELLTGKVVVWLLLSITMVGLTK